MSAPFPTIPRAGGRALISLAIGVLVFLITYGITVRMRPSDDDIEVRFHVVAQNDDMFQLFHASSNEEFSNHRVLSVNLRGSGDAQWVRFKLPPDSLVPKLRFDPGEQQDSIVLLRSEVVWAGRAAPIPLSAWTEAPLRHDIGTMRTTGELTTGHPYGDGLAIRFSGRDPYLTLGADLNNAVHRLRREHVPWLPGMTALLAAVLAYAGAVRAPAMRAVAVAPPNDVALTTLFPALLVLPALVLFHPGIEPEFPFTEKRRLAPYPPLEASAMEGYPIRFEAWYKDHFGFRKALYRWNSWAHVRILHASPLPGAVLLGKSGWLFQYDDRVDGDYRGLPLHTMAELENIRLLYEERQRKLAAMGIDYYVIIPPLSANINPEYLPDRIHRRSPLTWLGQVKEYFDRYSTVPIIDVSAELTVAKRTRPVYFSTDIHWNPYGAYFGYRKLIERIEQDRPEVGAPWPLEALRFEDAENPSADLAQLLGLDDIITRTVPVCIPLRPRQARFDRFLDLPPFQAHERPQLFARADTTGPRLLVLHDSFGVYLREYMSEHFARSTWVWTNNFRPAAVLEHKPDVVVQEFMEMFVPGMSYDSEPLP